MGYFADQLMLQDIDGYRMLIAAPFRYVLDNGDIVNVAAGFETDLASVPRLFWTLLPACGPHNRAAVVHDWLYARRRIETVDGKIRKPRRNECDWIFLVALKDCGVGWVKRNAMWLAVRSPAGAWVWRHGEGAAPADRRPMSERRWRRRRHREAVDPVA